jgi:hypothetical protein
LRSTVLIVGREDVHSAVEVSKLIEAAADEIRDRRHRVGRELSDDPDDELVITWQDAGLPELLVFIVRVHPVEHFAYGSAETAAFAASMPFGLALQHQQFLIGTDRHVSSGDSGNNENPDK